MSYIAAMPPDLQKPFDVGVVTVTVVRPTLAEAVRSVFGQRFGGRIHILVGVDRWQGERTLVDELRAACPSHVAVSVLDLGYSTSQRNGGIYPGHYGGALKTILSYAANSRIVTYLDDDNWYAPNHLETMRRQTTEFRDPGIWLIIAIFASGIGYLLGFVFIDQDLDTHDRTEGALEDELTTI